MPGVQGGGGVRGGGGWGRGMALRAWPFLASCSQRSIKGTSCGQVLRLMEHAGGEVRGSGEGRTQFGTKPFVYCAQHSCIYMAHTGLPVHTLERTHSHATHTCSVYRSFAGQGRLALGGRGPAPPAPAGAGGPWCSTSLDSPCCCCCCCGCPWAPLAGADPSPTSMSSCFSCAQACALHGEGCLKSVLGLWDFGQAS